VQTSSSSFPKLIINQLAIAYGKGIKPLTFAFYQ
jgi:hypothetical protein